MTLGEVRMTRVGWWFLAAIVAAGPVGCTGDIDGAGMASGSGPGGPGSGPGAAGASGAAAGDGAGGAAAGTSGAPGGAGAAGAAGAPARDPDMAGYTDPQEGGLFDTPAPATRVARLTHTQWANTVEDLLGVPADTYLSGLRDDPQQSGFIFDNNADALSVDEALWSGYQRAAVAIAEAVTSDSALLDKILPPDTGDAVARARQLVVDLGLRAHRRPLTDAQITRYLALYDQGATYYSGMGDVEAGARLLIEAMLQSPYFLYRVEQSNQADGDVIPLDSYEVAARLSYLLWNTMPDDELFRAAAASELTLADEVETQADRMLQDPRAEEVVNSFHHQLLEVEKALAISPSPAFFPDVSSELGQHAVTENEMFVRSVFEGNGGLTELLTSTSTFANDVLAEIYGLSGSFGSSFQPVELDATQRKGIFGQVAFLAGNATSVNPDPIHRGVFLARHMSCIQIAAPPANVPPLPNPDNRTNRQLVSDHTENPTTVCAGCHATMINPYGFPFESFDALGAYRTTDNGMPVDTSSSPLIDRQPTMVADSVELADAMAASTDVHECYAKHWLEFAYGRLEADEDESLVTRLAQRSLDDGLSMRGLIVGLVKTEAFLTRSQQELP